MVRAPTPLLAIARERPPDVSRLEDTPAALLISTTGGCVARLSLSCYYRDNHVYRLELTIANKKAAGMKRGRPPQGDRPMTATERKRAQRMRDRRAAMDAIGDEQSAPLRALLTVLGRVEASELAQLSAQRAWVEIGRRYGFVSVTKQRSIESAPSRNRK
jgi:hypothetical protein